MLDVNKYCTVHPYLGLGENGMKTRRDYRIYTFQKSVD